MNIIRLIQARRLFCNDLTPTHKEKTNATL